MRSFGIEMKQRSLYFHELSGATVYEILKARSLVFLLEQGIRCQDADDRDQIALHVLLEDESLVAYLRVLPLEEGVVKIGRVLTLRRGEGLGRRLLAFAEEEIREKMNARRVVVDAQSRAVPFYEKCGYTVISEEFMEEGVPHRKMEKSLY